jgi:hypothetical protein
MCVCRYMYIYIYKRNLLCYFFGSETYLQCILWCKFLILNREIHGNVYAKFSRCPYQNLVRILEMKNEASGL